MLTQKDTDRVILMQLNDYDLLSACQVNKYFNNLCNDNFFLQRIRNIFPNSMKYKPNNIGWKNYYLSQIYYIQLLRDKFDYIYKDDSFTSAKTLYGLILLINELGIRKRYFSESKYFILTDPNKKFEQYVMPYELYNLDYFTIEGLNIENIPKEIGILINLTTLRIFNTKIKLLPKEIGDLYNLEYLIIDGNKSLQNIPKEISKLKNLRNLNLEENDIKEIPREINRKNMPNLRDIFIKGNSVKLSLNSVLKSKRRII